LLESGAMKVIAVWAAIAAVAGGTAAASDPYAILREGYSSGDAVKASSAYAPEAIYGELYESAPPRLTAGRDAIAANFKAFFEATGAGSDLNFRIVDSLTASGTVSDAGFFRVRTKEGEFHGRFLTRRRGGLFETDVSAAASLADFEDAAGPVIFANDDEALAPAYYDALTGDYLRSGCRIRVSRSNWRLYAHDECSGQWRGLSRVSGKSWRGGETVIAGNGATAFDFQPDGDAALFIGGEKYDRAPEKGASRVTFRSGDLTLAGDLYPARGVKGRAPAVVLIHGSGAQDRRGYASIIELLARRFAGAGVTALAFDKRGAGESEGDWESAGFDLLAADVRAAEAYLASRRDIDAARIGYAGSSQAGWVAAQAIKDGAEPAFVILIGAAGAALTVAEQNLYNTKVRMECSGLRKESVDLALAQQKAFFDAKRDTTKQPLLTEATRAARADASIGDWLFPETAAPDGTPDWYDVLDPDFDPLPVWDGYRGRAYFLFGSLDDSTPAAVALARLGKPTQTPFRTSVALQGAQHLGLSALSLCESDLEEVSAFHPEFWPTVDRWAEDAARGR
jgi:alpha/beta superfamily hydrolase